MLYQKKSLIFQWNPNFGQLYMNNCKLHWFWRKRKTDAKMPCTCVKCPWARSNKTEFQLIYHLLTTLTAWCPIDVKSPIWRRTNLVRLTVRYKNVWCKIPPSPSGCQFRPGPCDPGTRPIKTTDESQRTATGTGTGGVVRHRWCSSASRPLVFRQSMRPVEQESDNYA